MVKPVLPFVEIMVTQACNLSCHGCTNYSDLVHNGYLTWEQGQAQITPWLERVEIPDFGILGGEPLMNPDIRNWIQGLRELMPTSQIRFTTNGLLLEKNFDIVDLLHDVGNVVFKIAVHQENEQLENTIKQIHEKFDWEPITEFGVARLKTSRNLRFHVRRPDVFYKTYQGTYDTMQPHNNDPAQAFAICCQQTCPLLYNGKLYKCSTSGLLEDVLKRAGYPNKNLWDKYLYDGLLPTATESELTNFLLNFGKPHQMCCMCPTKSDTQSTIVHLKNVSTKKIKL
jgi:organic radical activating enzyme